MARLSFLPVPFRLRPGARLEHFEIVELIASGGFGDVYEAFDRNLDRRVAIKVMQSRHSNDALARERFLKEARILASFRHPHIVQVYHVNVDGPLWLAMEYLDGWTLRELVAGEQPLPLTDVLHYMAGMADALATAHELTIIHRDVKLENAFVTLDNRVVVVDFGTAKVLSAGRGRTGKVVGTAGYLSPEQVLGEPVDARSDIYSMGLVMYELLTGRSAFNLHAIARQRHPEGGELRITLQDLVYMHVNQWPRDIIEFVPYIKAYPEVREIVWRAIQKDPARRFASARDFQAACLEARQRARDAASPARARSLSTIDSRAPLLVADTAPVVSTKVCAASRPSPASRRGPTVRVVSERRSNWHAFLFGAIVALIPGVPIVLSRVRGPERSRRAEPSVMAAAATEAPAPALSSRTWPPVATSARLWPTPAPESPRRQQAAMVPSARTAAPRADQALSVEVGCDPKKLNCTAF